MGISELLTQIIMQARDYGTKQGHEYITPEHILFVLCQNEFFDEIIHNLGGDCQRLAKQLKDYLEQYLESGVSDDPIESFALQQAIILASQQALNSGKHEIDLAHLVAAFFTLPESFGAYYLQEMGINQTELLFEICHFGEFEEFDEEKQPKATSIQIEDEQEKRETINDYLINLSENIDSYNDPLIGREDVLERTIQILCRRYKNNPIHIGEPGVGKTAISLGLAKRIHEGNIPKVLEGAQIFSLDIGGMLAGTQYRGDFEKRLKEVFHTLQRHPNPILYIDEIHNIVGAGSSGGGSLDASNLMKPYLTEGKIRCIGATTFEEYKKYLEKDKSLIRRFQAIEIKEPTVDETIAILQGLKQNYENYHQVIYTDEAIVAAAKLSHQYINDKFLPDKAIDLIDDAGAYKAMETTSQKKTVDISVIEEVLSKICHIPKQTIESTELGKINKLQKNLSYRLFGQDQAIESVVKAIKLWGAGLNDGQKPIASLLFVGPTGVGKTEIAKCLAESMGVKLIRFDMSEYTEKHTASKLIGAPAGYVGYEEGGLLTDAIRKNPYCVLLLDEIEKAHSDIFNMLLQVMDYATLTDNQGKKADFRNVVLIMTSNAGASQIGKSLVGFGERIIQGNAINDEVKKVFTPEFRNRLSSIVVFNHIDEKIALKITEKELSQFVQKVAEKNIKLSFTKSCITAIAQKGVSKEFGAREIRRIIDNELKPLLVEEILKGQFKNGGQCSISYAKDYFKIKIKG